MTPETHVQTRERVTRERLTGRYGRGRDGTIRHHGDCWIYAARICTCGLLHDLVIQPPEIQAMYPPYEAENAINEMGLRLVQEDRLRPQPELHPAVTGEARRLVEGLYPAQIIPDITKDTP